MRHQIKILIFLLPIALFLVFLFLKIAYAQTYFGLIQEDSPVEDAQAFFYFVSFTLFFLSARRLFKNQFHLLSALHLMLAIGLLLVFFEELSWGQRIFHLGSGEYFIAHNLQNEISLHNLDVIQPLVHKSYLLLGAYGTFAWLLLRLPILKSKPETHVAHFLIPDWFLSSYSVFVFLVYGLFASNLRPHAGSFFLWRDQEPAELLFSFGFAFFAFANFGRSRALIEASEIAPAGFSGAK